jgi:hypothetical protein
MGRFFLSFGVLAAVVGAVGIPLLSPAGRRGLLIAIGIAFAVQLLNVALLAALRVGTTGYLLARVFAGIVRLAVVALAAFALAGREGVDLFVAMMALVSLLFVLLLAESWVLRDREGGTVNG